MIPGSVPYRCNKFPAAAEACPLTCQTCGCEDTDIRFPVGNVTQTCAWVARALPRRCFLDGVRFYCPGTCLFCEDDMITPILDDEASAEGGAF